LETIRYITTFREAIILYDAEGVGETRFEGSGQGACWRWTRYSGVGVEVGAKGYGRNAVEGIAEAK